MRSHRKGPGLSRRAWRKMLVGSLVFFAVVVLSAGIYYVKEPVRRMLVRPARPDTTAMAAAIDSAYARIGPAKTHTSLIDLGDRSIRSDRLQLAKGSSIPRANYEITRAVEGAGGHITYGLESVTGKDDRRRTTTVTLGISDGERLVREVRLEKTSK